MNDLNVITQPTRDPKVFDVFWMTGLVQKGRIEVSLQFTDNARTAAELSAIHYLLVTKNACGHNKTGAGLRIRVSCADILPLLVGAAGDGTMARYANFLRTRFLGAQIDYDDGPYEWADQLCEKQLDFLRVYDAPQTTVEIPGVGAVEITAHAIDQYIDRFERKPTSAWRDFLRIAKDLQPMRFKHRSIFSDLKHRRKGTHLIDTKRKIVVVLANPDGLGRLPRWVTVFEPDEPNIRVLKNESPSVLTAA